MGGVGWPDMVEEQDEKGYNAAGGASRTDAGGDSISMEVIRCATVVLKY